MVGMCGLAAEVCKDVVLAGVHSLTVMDSRSLFEEDSANRFLCFNLGENVSTNIHTYFIYVHTFYASVYVCMCTSYIHIYKYWHILESFVSCTSFTSTES